MSLQPREVIHRAELVCGHPLAQASIGNCLRAPASSADDPPAKLGNAGRSSRRMDDEVSVTEGLEALFSDRCRFPAL